MIKLSTRHNVTAILKAVKAWELFEVCLVNLFH